jgi:hypothetical protein
LKIQAARMDGFYVEGTLDRLDLLHKLLSLITHAIYGVIFYKHRTSHFSIECVKGKTAKSRLLRMRSVSGVWEKEIFR